jgi:signal transduction histidine kinase
MRYLPGLATKTGTLALALSERAAGQLASGLVHDDPRSRATGFAAALSSDPPLALWSLCRAWAAGHGDLRTVADLAAWLASTEIVGVFGDEPRLSPVDPEDRLVWEHRAAAARQVAARAAELAAASGVDVDRAYLLGLLEAGPEWLASVGQVDAWPILVPDWLQSACQLARARGAIAASPEQCVAAAREPADSQTSAGRPANRRGGTRPALGGGELEHLLQRLARLERLESQFALALEAAKLDALKELAYGASHEINNPLANISTRAQALLEEEVDPQRRRTLAAIHAQALRAHEMIGDMMLFARPPKPKQERVDLAAVVARVTGELAPWAADQGTQFMVCGRVERLDVVGDPTQLAVALRALCVNALEALVTNGRVEISLVRGSAVPAKSSTHRESAQITVADTGPGISAETRQHLFDPFFSGREAGRGLGFGLSKCWRIVTLHGGRIDVASTVGQGASFTICLPLATDG